MVKKKTNKNNKNIIVIIIVIIILLVVGAFFIFNKAAKEKEEKGVGLEFGTAPDTSIAYKPAEAIKESTDVNPFGTKTNPFEEG